MDYIEEDLLEEEEVSKKKKEEKKSGAGCSKATCSEQAEANEDEKPDKDNQSDPEDGSASKKRRWFDESFMLKSFIRAAWNRKNGRIGAHLQSSIHF